MNDQTNATKTGKSPTHSAYQIREGKEKSYWTRIGAAWAHQDGKGFSLQIDSMPLDGKIAVRIISEKRDNQ